jgi:hypothetical protein
MFRMFLRTCFIVLLAELIPFKLYFVYAFLLQLLF